VAIFVPTIVAIFQTDVKRLLAYSSLAQIGYIILGISLASQAGLTAGITHIINHAMMKTALFLVLGCVMYGVGSTRLADMRGLGRRMPVTMFFWIIGGLGLVGVPLTVGFVSKWYLCVGALEAGHWYVLPVILLSSLLTVVYFWRLIERIYFGKMPDSRRAAVTRRAGTGTAPASMVAPTVVMGALCVVFGVAGMVPARIASAAAAMLLGGGG
jgi:multicomponent Na+:H+ antiporter subunit D